MKDPVVTTREKRGEKKEEWKDLWELNSENAHWSDKVAEKHGTRVRIWQNSLKEKLKILLLDSEKFCLHNLHYMTAVDSGSLSNFMRMNVAATRRQMQKYTRSPQAPVVIYNILPCVK